MYTPFCPDWWLSHVKYLKFMIIYKKSRYVHQRLACIVVIVYAILIDPGQYLCCCCCCVMVMYHRKSMMKILATLEWANLQVLNIGANFIDYTIA